MFCPTPPESNLPQEDGTWRIENIWKISPSMVGGLMGEMEETYGITRDNCLAYIWERNQPEYFNECLHEHGFEKTTKQWLEEHFNPCSGRNTLAKQEVRNEISAAILAPSYESREKHIANAEAAAELSLLSRTENKQYKNTDLEQKIYSILHGEITRQVFTESGTIGEEKDIISFFKDGNFNGLMGQKYAGTNIYDGLSRGAEALNGKPIYWNDNKGRVARPVFHVKISHNEASLMQGKTDEYFHNYRWDNVGMLGGKTIWGATAWGKFDGVLYGNTRRNQFYDVFEAKQRQGASSMNNVTGKVSEQIQMQIYMSMIQQKKEKNKPPWRFQDYPRSRNSKTGAWLLQTQWNSKNKDTGRLNQTFQFIPWNEELKVQIDKAIKEACQELWSIQLYQHRTEDAVSNGKAIQKRILESVAWKY